MQKGRAIAPPRIRKRKKRSSKPRRKNDEFLKGAFEENFPDFLRFVYPDADQIVDFDKGIEFMNNELFEIIPDRTSPGGGRRADLLAKIHLKDGTEKWILLNVEIEGGSDEQFASRVFQSNYRIRDRYKVSVASIAVFTGKKSQVRPQEYVDELLGTVLSFKYRAYHVFDDEEEALLNNKNPFSLIVLACQKSLLEGKLPDEELDAERWVIVRELLSRGYQKQRIISFLVFLKNFIFIDNKEINRRFDQQILALTGGKINMGIIETLKMQEREEGIEIGIQKGIQQGIRKGEVEKGHSVVENLIIKLGLSDKQAADVAEVSIAFVRKVRKELEAKK